ncbi:hypothetical protein AMATHDRAFT_7195 [Amanita thiersii Skay4041]|uniref:Uncharacterized protein n=1 Tax=Amanita thiersii Skay4041 TaxID=703135 RepID=A0A2A9NGY6_9AGAR|nr:hypothetical protein AMATHDRAFT_7195 [Amanita thiersii Skay4041]
MHSFIPQLALIALTASSVIAAPTPWYHDGRPDKYSQTNTAITGNGGSAPGGSSYSGFDGVNIGSKNPGNGGDASSGNAFIARHGGDSRYVAPSSDSHGSAYTGQGGQAPGGNVNSGPSLISLFSYNGGPGGDASSGDANSIHGHHPYSR